MRLLWRAQIFLIKSSKVSHPPPLINRRKLQIFVLVNCYSIFNWLNQESTNKKSTRNKILDRFLKCLIQQEMVKNVGNCSSRQ